MMRSVIEAAPMIIRAVGVIAVVASLLGAGAVSWFWWRLGRPIAFNDVLAEAGRVIEDLSGARTRPWRLISGFRPRARIR